MGRRKQNEITVNYRQKHHYFFQNRPLENTIRECRQLPNRKKVCITYPQNNWVNILPN